MAARHRARTTRSGWGLAPRSKPYHLTPRGIRWLADVWVNIGTAQLNGRRPSWSVRILRVWSWNSRKRELRFDGPGWLNFRRHYDPGAEPLRLIGTMLAVAGVSVTAVVGAAFAFALHALQAVAR